MMPRNVMLQNKIHEILEIKNYQTYFVKHFPLKEFLKRQYVKNNSPRKNGHQRIQCQTDENNLINCHIHTAYTPHENWLLSDV